MSSLRLLDEQARRTAQAIGWRMERIRDALESLAALTRTRIASPADPKAVLAWAENSLVRDPDGYLGRPRVLDPARAGTPDPNDFVFYVDSARFADREDVIGRMYRLDGLGPDLRRIRDRLGEVEWVYYQDGAGWALSFPSHDPTPTIPADFDWLSYLTFQSVLPSVNPEGELRWTPPNIDYGGKGLMVAASLPIGRTASGDLDGVWSIDVPVRSLVGAQEEIAEGFSTLIFDASGELIAHPVLELVVENEKGNWIRAGLGSLGPAFARLRPRELLEAGSGPLELQEPGRPDRLAHFHAIPSLGWIVMAVTETTRVVDSVRRSFADAFRRLGEGETGVRLDVESSGQVQALVDGFNDMATRLERTIREREDAQRLMSRSQRLQTIGQLAGAVAHDFNNLLTVVQGSAQLLEMRIGRDELLDDIVDASERAATLTQQLLAFGRQHVGRPEVLDTTRVIPETCLFLQRLLPVGVELAWEVPAGVPNVRMDRGHLTQVLLNLVVNARDALDGGGRIVVRGVADGEEVRLEVSDDGPGMSTEVLDRLFEPFFTTKTTGTGLGLATVHRVVHQAGGRISVVSTPGEGARFEIRLPGTGDLPDAAVPAIPERLEDLRILVLDDHDLVRSVTVGNLRALGATTLDAATTRPLAEALRAGHWDLLLTDVVMPGVGGREAARRLREQVPELAVVFMSGYPDDELLRLGFERGDEILLRKPFSRDELAGAVARALGRAPEVATGPAAEKSLGGPEGGA